MAGLVSRVCMGVQILRDRLIKHHHSKSWMSELNYY